MSFVLLCGNPLYSIKAQNKVAHGESGSAYRQIASKVPAAGLVGQKVVEVWTKTPPYVISFREGLSSQTDDRAF